MDKTKCPSCGQSNGLDEQEAKEASVQQRLCNDCFDKPPTIAEIMQMRKEDDSINDHSIH